MVWLSNDETITRVNLLIRDENLVYVVGVSRTLGEGIPSHLEHVFQPVGIIDVDVGNPIRSVRKEGKLQISVMIIGFEALCRLKPGGRMVQQLGHLKEAAAGHRVLRVFSQLLGHLRKKAISAGLV